MASVFTKIINGELPSYKIAEDDKNIAILDITPVQKGHVLVIPKKEVNKFYELEQEDYNSLMSFAKKIAIALEEAIPCKRIGMSVIGIEVPHTHIHLVPINSIADMNFSEKKSFTQEEFGAILEQIKEKL